jgi:6-pyruvoyltetrahydropterin/6-carboxytetrahydropterin synthase
MYEVTVEAGFSSGHYLRNYKGKCENPHGHNYRVLVTLAGAELDDTGLLLDFKLLKTLLRPVVDYLDHQLHQITAGRVRVKDCTIFETDTSFARYYE